MPPLDPATITANIGGAGVVALVLWLIWRTYRQDKSGADAQTDAAAIALLKEMRQERREAREELAGVRERVAVLEDDKRRHADVLQRHAQWDARVVAVLQTTDSSAAVAALGEPPPLYPQGG